VFRQNIAEIELRQLYKILGFSPEQIAEIEDKAEQENIEQQRINI
jgi:hypothetical protein